MRSSRLMLAGVAMLVAHPAIAETRCTIGQLLEFPVTMSGLQPMTTATVDGHEAHFVVDSGAFFSELTPGTAAEFGMHLSSAPAGIRFGGIGGEAQARLTTVKTLNVAGHDFHNIQFLVAGSEVGGAGLLGQNFLGLADAEYDLAEGAVRLMRSHNCDHGNLAYWSNGKPFSELPILSTTDARYHTKGMVTLDGARIEAEFDTGAATTILTTAAAARAGVRPNSPGVTRAGYSSGVGRKLIQTWIGTFKELTVGDEKIQKIRLRFGDVSEGSFDMLIGADFFLSHRVYVDNQRHRLFFTYNGGPVFDLKTRMPGPEMRGTTTADVATTTAAPVAVATAAPSNSATMTAQDYSRRGSAEASRRDFVSALADFDRATTMTPDDAGYRYQHALVLSQVNRLPAAREEVDRALTLRPAYPEALMLRATLRFRTNDRAGAKRDLDAVSASVAAPADVRLELGDRYETLGEEGAAIGQFDQWIAAHPDDSRLPEALNSRCWTRALVNVDIDGAIADCNRSLRLRPHIASTIDSRGWAYLRRGDLDRAVKDFDEALTMNPKIAWSLYGRGIVRIRKGQKAEGDADMAAAVELRPAIPRMAERFGIKP